MTFSKQEKHAELPYHLLPEHTQQAMIINAFSLDEKTSATFRLLVGFIQKAQSRLQKDLVDLSLSNAFSIAKLDFISIKAKSNSAMLIDLPTSQQKAMIHVYDGSSQFIVKYIYLADSAGAHTSISCNKTTFRALEFIVVSTSFANFQLIVDLFLIQNREGASEVPITHYSASEGDRSQSLLSASDKSITLSLKTNHVQRLIVEFIKADIKNVHGSRARSTT